MTTNLTCAQVNALLPFFIDGKLSSHLQTFVEAHLKVCPKCKVKFESLKKMIASLREMHKKISQEDNIDEISGDDFNEELKTNLSAYVDNELDEVESIKVKKNIISNEQVRSEVENMYFVKKMLKESFEKEKNNFKDDYSKMIFDKINIKEQVYSSDSFLKVFFILTSLVTLLMLAAFVIFLN